MGVCIEIKILDFANCKLHNFVDSMWNFTMWSIQIYLHSMLWSVYGRVIIERQKEISIIHSIPHKSLVVYLHTNVNVIVRKENVFHMCLLIGK